MVEILKLMLNQDSEIEELCGTCDMNSTLGSVVPLAMFSFWASEQKTVRTGLDCIILKTGTTTRAPAMLKLIIISGKSTSY